MSDAIYIMLDKFPVFDPTWPQETQERWIAEAEKLVKHQAELATLRLDLERKDEEISSAWGLLQEASVSMTDMELRERIHSWCQRNTKLLPLHEDGFKG